MKHLEVHFEIEEQCNLRCLHCSSIGNHGASMKYSLNDIITLIQLFECKTYVHYTGGEPLLNDKLEELVASASDAGADVGLFTTGIKSNSSVSFEYWRRLRDLGLKFCYFSIYSTSPNIHDRMTTVNGTYFATIKSIQTLVSLKVDAYANVVVYKDNIHELDNIIMLLASVGVTHVRLLRLVKHGNAVNNWDIVGVEMSEQECEIGRIISNAYNYPVSITVAGFPQKIACRP